MPPDPSFDSSRYRPESTVELIRSKSFAFACGPVFSPSGVPAVRTATRWNDDCPGPLLHRSRLSLVMGCRAGTPAADVGVRGRARVRLGDGWTRPAVRPGVPRRGRQYRRRLRLLLG